MDARLQAYRVSQQQARLWQLRNDGSNLCAQCSVLIQGPLDEEALRGAARRIVERQEILRTTFRRQPGMRVPFQIIGDPVYAWKTLDLTATDEEACRDEIQSLLREDASLVSNPERLPVLRLSLVILSKHKAILSVTIAALCADSQTLDLFVEELSAQYKTGASAESEPDGALQYADFSEWQEELLKSEDALKGTDFWLSQRPSSKGLKFPFALNASDNETTKPNEHRKILEPELVNNIINLSSSFATTPGVFLLTCWQVFLWRLVADEEIIVAVQFDGRKYDDLKGVMGLFARYLPVRLRASENTGFDVALGWVIEAFEEAYEWEEFATADALWPDKSAVASIPFGFAFYQSPPQLAAGDTSFSVEEKTILLENHTLDLNIIESKDSYTACFHFDGAIIDDAAIKYLAGEFETIIQSIISNTEAAIGSLNLVSPALEQKMLEQSQGEKRAYADNRCINQFFEEQVERTPEAVAVVCEGIELSFQELNFKANRIARRLRQLGVGPDVTVAICLERSVDVVVSLMAVMKAGGAYIPLELHQPQDRLKSMVEDGRARFAITHHDLRDRFSAEGAIALCLDTDWKSIAEESCENLEPVTDDRNIAYVIFTSGSTGRPKGVAVEHRQLTNYVRAVTETLNLKPARNYGLISSFAADLGNTVIFPSLCFGGCLHIISQERATDPVALADYFTAARIDYLKVVPSHLNALLTLRNPEQVLPTESLILGGEASGREMLEKIFASAPDCKVFNHYGPTETTIGTLTSAVEDSDLVAQTVPLGKPLPNTQAYILNDDLKQVAIGELGELFIGGAGVARGYISKPDITAERFIPDPFSLEPGSRMYRTGDCARRRADGKIEFAGRTDNQIKFHGHRIELDELRFALLKHPQVTDGAVVLRKDDKGKDILAAYYVSKTPLDTLHLREFLSKSVIAEILPNAFVHLRKLPLTSNGKIKYAALPSPEKETRKRDQEFAEETPAQSLILKIWKEVLCTDEIGIHDNFFEIGGDSILSIQIIAKASQFGFRMTPDQLFQHQTVAELAAVAGRTYNIEAEQGIVTGPVALTPIQHWFFQKNLPNPDHWNQSLLLEPGEKIYAEGIEQALNELLNHHDALRLRFVRATEGWEQINSQSDQLKIELCDLSSMDEQSQLSAIELKGSQLHASLNLSEGPLVQAALFDLGQEKRQRLLIVIHHLAVDGVSWRVLLEDLETAYKQVRAMRPVELPVKTTSFKSWSERLSKYAASSAAQDELDFWIRSLPKDSHSLPVDRAEGENTEGSAKTFTLQLTTEQTRALLQEVPANYRARINEVLLAALATALKDWAGNKPVLLKMEGHGREGIIEDVDLSRTTGWFTTHYPLLLDLGEAGDSDESLRYVKQRLRAVPTNGIGYGILKYLTPDQEVISSLLALPYPQISFNYLGQFDQVLGGSSLFQLASESCGAFRSADCSRDCLIDIIALVVRGQLRIDCVYSANHYDPVTIETLMHNFIKSLQELIENRQLLRTSHYTPADFPLADLNDEKLSKISSLLESIDAE